ncbi:unnamed protein product [Durusdinium trenchii]|uniref:Uncharacterized protein n=1 Tax=Durusdinium trenchii TaxID=1381693 RepID=A0ABP0MP25_9DINO
MAPSFVLLLCPVVTVMAMRASEGSEQEGWPFSSDDVVITRQYDSTKMDYVELFKSMWKKIPYDVKMSGNSWSIVDLMLTKPTLAFDCEEANQDSDIFLVMSELPSELSKDSRVSEENVVGMLDDVSRVFEQINEVFDYKVDVPNMAKSFYNGMSLQEALDKVMQAGEDLRSTITEKKQNLLGGFAARKWKSAFSFYKGTHVQAFLTTKPPVQYGKTAVKLKCYKAQSTRLLGFEGSKETSSFLPFTAKHFALMVLDVAV